MLSWRSWPGRGWTGWQRRLSKDGYAVTPVLDAVHNPKAVEALQACAAVVLVEMPGRSSLTAIRNSAAQVENAGKSVLGVVTI